MNENSRVSVAGKEAFLTSNALLSSGSIIAPAVVVATGFMQSLALCIVFSIVTYVTIAVCSFVPRKLVYTVRIILYTFVASLVYVPVSIMMEGIMPVQYAALEYMRRFDYKFAYNSQGGSKVLPPEKRLYA